MTKKRFIAGAICPRCQIEDRLVVENVGGKARRRCVSCGFSDEHAPDLEVTLPTRFVRRGLDDAEARPIKLVDD